MQSRSAIPQAGNIKTYRGGGTTALLILSFFVGMMMCVPSTILDLRVQEGIFPLLAVGVFIAGMIWLQFNEYAGLFILFLLLMCIWRFTPQAYSVMTETVIYAGLFYAVVYNYYRIQTRISWLYNIICVIALLNVLWVFFQYGGYYVIFILRDKGHYTGFFANRIETAIFIASSVPFFFRRGWCPYLIFVGLALILLQSTTGMICAMIAVTAWGGKWVWARWGKAIVPLVAGVALCLAIVLSFLFSVHFGNWGQRMEANIEAAKLVSAKPLFGWGIGQGQFIIPLFLNAERQEPKLRDTQYAKVLYQSDLQHLYDTKHNKNNTFRDLWRELHNDHLQMALEIGIVGYVLFALMVGSIGVAYFRTKAKDSLVFISLFILLFSAGSFFTFQIGRFVFMAVILAGLIQGARQCQES